MLKISRSLLLITLMLVSLSSHAEESVFRKTEESVDSSLQTFATFIDLGLATLAGAIGIEEIDKKARWIKRTEWKDATFRLKSLHQEFDNDDRLARYQELKETLEVLLRIEKDACREEIAMVGRQLAALANTPGRSLEQWNHLFRAAEDALNKAVKSHQLHVTKGYLFLSTSGFLIFQAGSRLWIWSAENSDPGAAPGAVLGYRYVVRPIFKLIGIRDTVENLWVDETDHAKETSHPEESD